MPRLIKSEEKLITTYEYMLKIRGAHDEVTQVHVNVALCPETTKKKFR